RASASNRASPTSNIRLSRRAVLARLWNCLRAAPARGGRLGAIRPPTTTSRPGRLMRIIRGRDWWRRSSAALLVLGFCVAAHAQDYPSRVIKMICGFPAGGNVDAIARVMANEMAVGLGVPVVVETRPGMVGSLAAEFVARAAPDGYTLLTLPGAPAVTGALYKNLKYRPVEDFAWISTVSFYPFVVTVRADSRFRTLAELIAAARGEAGRVTYGSSGAAAIQHMIAELLGASPGVKFQHLPYPGEALAVAGLPPRHAHSIDSP